MLTRCYDLNCPHYPNYGGRGISVCERWRNSFTVFLADVGKPPYPDWSLDRIDPNGHYELGNVRWAPQIIQDMNKRMHQEILARVCGRLNISRDKLFEAFLSGEAA